MGHIIIITYLLEVINAKEDVGVDCLTFSALTVHPVDMYHNYDNIMSETHIPLFGRGGEHFL